MRTAIYAGSFDPVTLGHVDLIERAGNLFDQVIIAVGRHATKKAFFSFQERLDLLIDRLLDVAGWDELLASA